MDEVSARISMVRFKVKKVTLTKIPREAFRSTPINSSDPVTVQLDDKEREVALTKKAIEKVRAAKEKTGKWIKGEWILLHKAVLALIPNAESGSGALKEGRKDAVRNAVQAAWAETSQRIRDVAKQPNMRARAEREWKKALKEKVEARLKPVFKEIRPRLTKKMLLEIWEETHKERVVSEVMER